MIKKIGLVAHDGRKKDLIEWAKTNKMFLEGKTLFGTGTTGSILEKELGLKVKKYQSGPLGGDIQIGEAIINDEIDMLIFFWDPLEAQPHDPDVKALLRISVLYNTPVACNQSTADFLIRSEYYSNPYTKQVIDYTQRLKRHIELS